MSGSTLDVAVYGIINAGKSSLINALSRRDERPASPIGGSTVEVAEVICRLGPESSEIHLIDTPGLEEVGDEGRGHLATEAAKGADLVLFVVAEDLTATSRRALMALLEFGKPVIVALNKVDLLGEDEQGEVLASIRSSLSGLIDEGDILPIAAAPIVRKRMNVGEGIVRTETVRGEPDIGELETRLVAALSSSATDLKDLSAVTSQIDQHLSNRELDRSRLRARAEQVADETSAGLALALAVNPVPLLDFFTGPGGLTILVMRVANVYGEAMTAEVARGLALELIRGGRVVLWGSLAATLAGGAFKLVPGVGHLAGAITQGAAAGYFGHVVGRALVGYLDRGHDWGDGGLIAELDRIAASTDRRALTRGLVDRIKTRVRGKV